ncbi:MAG: hypothetical protein GY866_35400 [Proteobacteria bacterium]|nr:hypothetical protein [Pseudomonadota bacterium]
MLETFRASFQQIQGEKMKRSMLLIAFMGLMISLSGCVYMSTEEPGIVRTGTVFQLTSNDFEVIDRVSATGETTLWFGAVLVGGIGYQALLAEAEKIGGDEIMNYSFDMERTSILGWIYSNVEWKATGFAVKLKSSIRKGQ